MSAFRLMRSFKSKIDASENFVVGMTNTPTQTVECRYVRRTPEKLSVYVSSLFGCPVGCRFCHLTATDQISSKRATLPLLQYQLATVLESYSQRKPVEGFAKRLNIDFMAQGDALINAEIVNNYPSVYKGLFKTANIYGFTEPSQFRINMSTVMPMAMRGRRLASVFADAPVHLFYSGYTPQADFRKYWMPGAMGYEEAVAQLKEFQEKTGQTVTLHHCYIQGGNDRDRDVDEMCRVLSKHKLKARFSIVRYNPPPKPCGTTAGRLLHLVEPCSTRMSSPGPRASTAKLSCSGNSEGVEELLPYTDALGNVTCRPVSSFVETSDERLGYLFKRVCSVLTPDPKFPSKIIPRIGTDVKASCGAFLTVSQKQQ